MSKGNKWDTLELNHINQITALCISNDAHNLSWVFHLVAQAMHSWTDSSALDPSHTGQPYFFCEPTGKIQLATSAYTSIIALSHHSLASPLLHFHLLSWDGPRDFFPAYPPMPLHVSSAWPCSLTPNFLLCFTSKNGSWTSTKCSMIDGGFLPSLQSVIL